MKPIKPGNRVRHRALLLAAVPLTAVLAGGVAVAATSGSNSPAPPGTATTQQDRDRARDGSCLDSPTVTAAQLRDRDQVRDRARDGSCLDSPTAVPGATAQHMYEHRYQHGDDATDR
jgi:hypothetical protein